MNPRSLRQAALCLSLLAPLAAQAQTQEKGYWRAASKTARAITGDVAFADDRFSINFLAYPTAQIRALKPDELGAAFDADTTSPGSGNLYGLNIAGATKFLHKNTLCGGEDARWMATYVSGKNLQVAFFSGPTPPVLTLEALSNNPNLCGTYSYVR